jgi:uncharacterized damage-inducible protein DinB
MNVHQTSLEAIYAGWRNYQKLLIVALAPLTPEQLALRAASNLRSIEEIVTHMIGARGRWFAPPLGDGSPQLAAFGCWDRRAEPVRTAAEIVTGLQFTLDYIHAAIASWTPSDWQGTIPGEGLFEPGDTRQWVVWHLIEHDLHHGGEISLTLGMHQLTAPAL